jgi:hypothetical protein
MNIIVALEDIFRGMYWIETSKDFKDFFISKESCGIESRFLWNVKKSRGIQLRQLRFVFQGNEIRWYSIEIMFISQFFFIIHLLHPRSTCFSNVSHPYERPYAFVFLTLFQYSSPFITIVIIWLINIPHNIPIVLQVTIFNLNIVQQQLYEC